MYSYSYDKKTGGLLLNSSPTGFSREPRPVYASELDILGFDKYWKYDRQTDRPYMWAEANRYYCRGMPVAKLKGGNICTAPEIIIANDRDGKPIMPEAEALQPVDTEAMAEANREMLKIIGQATTKRIADIFDKYKDKVDCFHVAFSGGKDSCVLLDLIKKTLPRGSFRVLFDDTGMEFFDTYNVVKKTQQQCAEDGIPFYIAKSHLNPEESWKLFGPPARVLRWCCSVHKSTPHTLKLREVTGKNNFIGLNFVGVRAHESIARSTYEFENYSKKQKGQFSHNSILDWTSAEVWLYVYANNLLINEAYKKGNRRVGCLLCPMSGGATNCLRRMNYPAEVAGYVDLIKNAYNGDEHKIESCGGWCARKSGRDLSNNVLRCVEKIADGVMTITVIDPTSDWSEWIKTLGNLRGNNGNCSVQFKGESINFSVNSSENGYVVTIPEAEVKKRPTFRKIFRQVFRKASYCKCCRVCEANCRNGCISFTDGKVKISDCTGCRECHAISNGCLLFNSLRQSKISDKNQKEKRGK